MLFTRFPINMSRRDAYKLLASPYNMHAAISCSFPPSENRADNSNGRILWRIPVIHPFPISERNLIWMH